MGGDPDAPAVRGPPPPRGRRNLHDLVEQNPNQPSARMQIDSGSCRNDVVFEDEAVLPLTTQWSHSMEGTWSPVWDGG
jgi:hypothetical protein